MKSNLTIEGTAVVDKDDAAYSVVRDAAWNRTVLDVIVLDGPEIKPRPMAGECRSRSAVGRRSSRTRNIVTNGFTMKPARSAFPPEQVSGPIA